MADIFTLGLKADSSGIVKGKRDLDNMADSADKAESKAGKLRDGVNVAGQAVAAFGALATAALGGIVVSASNAASEIDKMARLSNQTVEEFQRNAYAAQQFGVEADKLGDILKDTQDKVGDFLTTGAGGMVDFFENVAPKIGVTADQFRGLNGKDALQLYVSSLEAANLSQSEMVFYLEAIASDATLLQPLLANNGAEFDRLTERADALNVVLSEFDVENLREMGRVLDDLSAVAGTAADQVGGVLAPFITDLGERMLAASTEADGLVESTLWLVGAGVKVAGVFADAGRVFEIVGMSIAAYAYQVTESFDTVEQRIDLAVAKYWQFASELDLAAGEAANSMLEKFATGVEGMVNSMTRGLNEVIRAINDSGVAQYLELELSKVSEFKFDIQPIDLSGVESDLAAYSDAVARLEGELEFSSQNVTDAWQTVLDKLGEPLPSQQFDGWFDGISKVISAQKDLQKEVKKTGVTAITTAGERAKGEKKFSDDVTSKQISDLKNVTSIAASAMGERSKAREALHNAEKAFTAVEMALSFKKSAANAVEAITAAFAAPWPIGFASGAAMIAVMAGLGVFSGGGGGSAPTAEDVQAEQGTGTVLGASGDKSQSILDAQQRYEDIEIDQLAELRGIRDSMTALSAGITELAQTLVRGSGIGEYAGSLEGSDFNDTFFGSAMGKLGDFLDLGGITSSIIGGLSKTTKTIIDEGIQFVSQSLGSIIDEGIVQAQAYFTVKTKKKKLWGLSSSSSTDVQTQDIDNEIAQQMAAIFGHIGDTVLQSAKALGFETVSVINESFTGPLFDPENMRDRVGGALTGVFESVEMSLDDALAKFNIDIGQISFEGLSGEEIQRELEAIFSQQSDLIAEYLVPSIAEYQQIGEGLFDTLLRVTKEQAIFNDAIEAMGMSLSDLSNTMQIEVAQGIIAIIGSAERFADLTQQFFSEFYSDSEQFAMLTDSITEALAGLGLGMFDSREAFREMMEGLDLTTESGRAMFAALLELVPAMDEYFDSLENDAAREAAAAERELEAARREAEAAAREAARAEAEAIREAERAAREAERAAAQLLRELEGAAGEAYRGLVASVKQQQDALRATLDADLAAIEQTFMAHRAAVAATSAATISALEAQMAVIPRLSDLTTAAESALGGLAASVKQQQDVLAAGLRGELDTIGAEFGGRIEAAKQRTAAQIESMAAQAATVKESAGALRSLSQSLKTAVESVTGFSREQARAIVQGALDAGDVKGADLARAIGKLTDINADSFSSALDMQTEQARTATQLGELKDLADGQLSEAEQNLAMLERQIDTVRSAGEAQVEAIKQAQQDAEQAAQARHDEQAAQLQSIVDAARAQLDAVLGRDSAVKPLDAAMAEFEAALAALAGGADNEAQIEAILEQIEVTKAAEQAQIDALNAAEQEALAARRAQYEAEYEALQAIADSARSQLDALMGVDSSVKSLTDAQAAFNSAALSLAEKVGYEQITAVLEGSAILSSQTAELQQTTLTAVEALVSIDTKMDVQAAALSAINASIASVAVTPPPVVLPPWIVPPGDQTIGNPRPDDRPFSNEDTLKAIAISSAKTAKLLDRWDGDGQPDIRTA